MTLMDENTKWVKIDSWHLLKETRLTPNGTWMMKTLCGIDHAWDQTFLEALPGGDETSCENCLIIKVGKPRTTSKPKRSRKTK
jgi:hypothetical protein